ncbi:MAG: hypothetical protein K9M11_01835 [Candidatus Pacebacteria bacterium]|nr:hypothetical protein [Candidatus Paceibacterota bacterium]
MNKEKALRLQNVTILFDIAWETYKKYFKVLLKLNILPVIIVLTGLSIFSMIDDFEDISKYLDKYDFIMIAALILGVVVISVVVSSLNYIAQITVLNQSSIKDSEKYETEGDATDIKSTEVTLFGAYSVASKLLFPYFWIMLLTGLLILIGFVLLVVPGVVFSIWFVFASFFLVFEGKRGKSALQMSKRYVRGIWFEVFLRLVVAALLGLLLNIALATFKGFMGSVASDVTDTTSLNLFLDFIYQLVITPYFVVYMYELYRDVVKANEPILE